MGIVEPANSAPLHKNDDTMVYRPFGKTGLEVSALSFGCMRLQDDADLNKKLISRAVDLGVNYFETTRYYLAGTCQQRTVTGLDDRRNSIIVSGKDGINPDRTAYLYLKEMERQLEILGLTHFKFYQVGWFSWGAMPHLLKDGGIWDAIREAKRTGLVQHIGFTGHDSPENFIKCIETGLFDSLTVPYNLVNRAYEPTIKRAGELGVGVVAMCPVAGGMLSWEASRLQEALDTTLPTTEMALQFVLANPDVSTACSGMNTLAQLEENVTTVKNITADASRFQVMCEGLDRLRASLGDRFCTSCRYCMPCPQGVDIPGCMQIAQNWKTFGLDDWARDALAKMPEEKRPERCTQCGACESACPNELSIQATLQELAELAQD